MAENTFFSVTLYNFKKSGGGGGGGGAEAPLASTPLLAMYVHTVEHDT